MPAPGADVATRSASCSCDLGHIEPPSFNGALRQGAVTCLLRPQLDSVKVARNFVRATLHDWGLRDWFDNVGLVASELVTNALSHGLHLAGAPTERCWDVSARGGPGPIRLSLTRQESCVMCSVSDPSSRVPVQREPDPLAGEGYGLSLIESLSHAWDWQPLTSGGKIVWAVFCSSRIAGSNGTPKSAGARVKTTRPRRSTEPRLTRDEISLLDTVASGVPLDVAARQLGISPRTLRRRVRAICDRIGVNTTIEAVVWAVKRKLI